MRVACDSQCVELKQVVELNIDYARNEILSIMDKDIETLQNNRNHYRTLSQKAKEIDKQVREELEIGEYLGVEEDLNISRDTYRATLVSKIDMFDELTNEDKKNLIDISEKGGLNMNNWEEAITTITMTR